MSTSFEVEAALDSRWPLAAVVGGAAGLVRPAGLAALELAGVDPGVVAMTVQPELPMWWLVHLAYTFGFGAVYGAVGCRGRLCPLVVSPRTGALTGLGYGLVLWLVNGVVVLELVVGGLLPGLSVGEAVGPLVGHVVYGLVLGAAYPLARTRA